VSAGSRGVADAAGAPRPTAEIPTLRAALEVERPDFPVWAALSATAGRPLALVGPNGAGKSTVLQAIAGHVPIASGSIRLGDRELTGLPAEARRIGVVFQDFLLFPHLTVADNVAYGVRMRGTRRAAARAAALPWLERFELAELAARYPHELSGGQAQRVALARALAAEPEALLLDEPMAALDVEIRDEVRAELAGYLRAFAGPTVIVTHSAADVAALAADIVVLERGAVTQSGTWDSLRAAPATPYVARLVERREE
jgi:ABC-type sulfate/molybdate transport systems ATPase subunit